jgi:hypothetical protein
LMLDGLVKIRGSLRQSRPVTFRDVLGVLTFWYAIKINDLRAAIRARLGSTMPFVRTPKVSVGDPSRWTALKAAARSSRPETLAAAGLLGVAVVSLVLWTAPGSAVVYAYYVFLAWLVYYAYAFGSTIWFDYQSRLSVMRSMAPAIPAGVATGAAETPSP